MCKSVVFFFRGGRRDKLKKGNDGVSEFFFGFGQFRASSKFRSVGLNEESDFPLNLIPGRFRYLRDKLKLFFLWIFLLRNRNRSVVFTYNSIAEAYLELASNYRYKHDGEIFFIVMGFALDEKKVKILEGDRKLTTIFISRVEFDRSLPGKYRKFFIPFGVDNSFWVKSESKCKSSHFIAVGNDLNRDWAWLLSVWRENLPKLKIFSCTIPKSLVAASNLNNVEIIAADWREDIVSDEALRLEYQTALGCIIPVKVGCIQPSGQSVLHQAVACGCDVVISAFDGFWLDDRYVGEHSNVFVVERSEQEFVSLIRRISSKNRNSFRSSVDRSIVRDFSCEGFAKCLEQVICEASESVLQ